MGIYDRDYYRDPAARGGFGYFNVWSVTTWLIVANVAVFFADNLLQRVQRPDFERLLLEGDAFEAMLRFWMGPLERWGYFSTETAIYHGQVWRLLTFQFLHASPGHLIGNMLGMFFFGPIVEGQFGARRYLAFYLLCGLAGAASYLLLSLGGVVVTSAATPLVGASAGVFGLLVAAAMIAPDMEVFVFFATVPVRVLAIFGMLVAAFGVFRLAPNAGGEAGHLGGGVLGFLLMKNQHWLSPFAPARRRPAAAGAGARRRPRRNAFQKDWSKDMNR